MLLLTTFAALLWFQSYGDSGDGGGKIRWLDDPKAAVDQAKKTHRPIIFYVLGRTDDRDDDIERDQKRALADPLVTELSKRFVCCKLSRSRHRDVLESLKLRSEYQMYMVFVRPGGGLIDQLDGLGVSKKDTLAQKMAAVFRVYRKELFEKELKPVLAASDAKPADVKKALEMIDEYTIVDADRAVIDLLKREGVDKSTEKAGYGLLAKLSTKPAVDFLLEKAADKQALGPKTAALKVLGDCTPGGAELMLPALDGEDAELRLAVYQAVAKITRAKDVKQPRFWEGKNERAMSEEMQRIKKHVESVARKWRDRYEEYR